MLPLDDVAVMSGLAGVCKGRSLQPWALCNALDSAELCNQHVVKPKCTCRHKAFLWLASP